MYVNQLKAAFPNLKFIDTAHASLALSPQASYSKPFPAYTSAASHPAP
jgi:hypothetical protein